MSSGFTVRVSSSDQRQFQCDHCQGVITIPANLPPTKAPCPHCGQETTSPDFQAAASPVATSGSVATEPQAEVPSQVESQVAVAGSGGKAGVLVAVLSLLLVGLLSAGVFFLLNKKGEAEDVGVTQRVNEKNLEKKEYLKSGWREDASKVLDGFLKAKTPEEMAELVIAGEDLLPAMKEFYANPDRDESGLTESQFQHFPIAMEDRERGIFMMRLVHPEQWNLEQFFQPLPTIDSTLDPYSSDFLIKAGAVKNQFLTQPKVIRAFFKHDGESMKLDWQTYVQTKYALFSEFLGNPVSGQKKEFRLVVQEDIDYGIEGLGENDRVFYFADAAYPEAHTRIVVDMNSQPGKHLSEILWRGTGEFMQARNATVELAWTNEAKPRLTISRFLCWEFLGVGGEQIVPDE